MAKLSTAPHFARNENSDSSALLVKRHLVSDPPTLVSEPVAVSSKKKSKSSKKSSLKKVLQNSTKVQGSPKLMTLGTSWSDDENTSGKVKQKINQGDVSKVLKHSLLAQALKNSDAIKVAKVLKGAKVPDNSGIKASLKKKVIEQSSKNLKDPLRKSNRLTKAIDQSSLKSSLSDKKKKSRSILKSKIDPEMAALLLRMERIKSAGSTPMKDSTKSHLIDHQESSLEQVIKSPVEKQTATLGKDQIQSPRVNQIYTPVKYQIESPRRNLADYQTQEAASPLATKDNSTMIIDETESPSKNFTLKENPVDSPRLKAAAPLAKVISADEEIESKDSAREKRIKKLNEIMQQHRSLNISLPRINSNDAKALASSETQKRRSRMSMGGEGRVAGSSLTTAAPKAPVPRRKRLIPLVVAIGLEKHLSETNLPFQIVETAKYGKNVRRQRSMWSDAEIAALDAAINVHGTNWAAIRDDKSVAIDSRRTTVDIKDKWRNLIKIRNATTLPLRKYLVLDSVHRVLRCETSGKPRILYGRYPRDAALKAATRDDLYPSSTDTQTVIFIRELVSNRSLESGDDEDPVETKSVSVLPVYDSINRNVNLATQPVHVYEARRTRVPAPEYLGNHGVTQVWNASVRKTGEERFIEPGVANLVTTHQKL